MSTPNGVTSPPPRSESATSLASLGKRKRAESEDGVEIAGVSTFKKSMEVHDKVRMLELLKDTLVILRR